VTALDVLEILKELVEINTVNQPDKGIKPSIEAAKYIRARLNDIGVKTELIEKEGFYSVLGIMGSGEPIILFLAHYDTVPVDPSKWKYDPFKLTMVNDRAYGRGALDDKSNVAAIIAALNKISSEGANGTIISAFTGDEEIGGRRGSAVIRDLLIERGLKPNYLINGDGHGMYIIVRRRNAFRVQLKIKSIKRVVKGRKFKVRFEAKTPIYETRHAAYFMPGVDLHPVIAASYYLRTHPELKVSSLRGDFLKSNVVPEWVEVEFVEPSIEDGEVAYDDGLTALLRSIVPIVRAPASPEMYSDYGVSITPNMYRFDGENHVLNLDVRAMTSRKEALKPIEIAVRENLGDRVELGVYGGSGYLYTSRASKLVVMACRVLEEMGIEPFIVEMAGASDSRYFSPLGIEAIDFGPKGGNLHGPNEYVEIKSLIKTVEFYHKLALKLMEHEHQ